MKRIHAFVAALVAAFATSVAAQTKWDMPTPYAATNFHTENVAQFVADVDKAPAASSRSRCTQRLALQGERDQARGAGQPGADRRDPDLRLLQRGSDLRRRLRARSSRRATPTREALEGLAQGARGPLREAGHDVLYSVPWPPQGVYSTKPLNSVADMKGLKMRSYNPATSRIAELAGAQPVTIQAAELAQAMATGAVNANITSGATGYDTKAWEVVKNYYDTQAWLPKNIVFVNKQAFDALDKPTQRRS
jgi:TRAP-type C4-dicarboxylate transport system substrate-binding protein